MFQTRMPRRKKRVKEATEAQNLEKKDAETASSVNLKRKRRFEDAFIVISDSDGEVSILNSGALALKLGLLHGLFCDYTLMPACWNVQFFTQLHFDL